MSDGYSLTLSNSLKIVIVFALLNSIVFLAYHPAGFDRLVIAGMMNISGLLLVIFFARGRHFFAVQGTYFPLVLLFLIFWSLITIVRGVNFEQQTMATLFGHYLMSWAWLTPLAVVYGVNPECWRVLSLMLRRLLLAAIPASLIVIVFFRKDSAIFGLLELTVLCVPGLLFKSTSVRRSKIVTYCIVLNFVILSALVFQRANFIFLSIILLFMFFEWSRNSARSVWSRLLLPLGLMIVTTFAVQLDYANLVKASRFDNITVDTRTFLFTELADDFSAAQVIYGRGVLGTYYSPYFAFTESHGLEGDSSTRSVVEVGYLHMILKGGAIMVILCLIVLVPAAYLGVFRSNNSIAKGGGYLIAAYLVMWTVSYYPVFNAENIILWMAVGACTSPRFRALRDTELF